MYPIYPYTPKFGNIGEKKTPSYEAMQAGANYLVVSKKHSGSLTMQRYPT